MATVKINNKTYQVPELSFAHSRRMEQMGLPVEGLIDRKYIFTAASTVSSLPLSYLTQALRGLPDGR